jgi:hypothetical protein
MGLLLLETSQPLPTSAATLSKVSTRTGVANARVDAPIVRAAVSKMAWSERKEGSVELAFTHHPFGDQGAAGGLATQVQTRRQICSRTNVGFAGPVV